jgi:mannitol/fructose-specific phosphotransferase system IIA component (Ntr-type)
MLEGRTPREVIEELVALLCRDRADLSPEQVLHAVLARERDIGTRINSVLAMPHARLLGVGNPMIAVGLSREGLIWGGSAERSVRLVILLLGDEKQPQLLLDALAIIARAFLSEDALEHIASVKTPEQLYRLLVEYDSSEEASVDPGHKAVMESVYTSACALAEATNAACMLMLTDQLTETEIISKHAAPCATILATTPRNRLSVPYDPFDQVIEIPLRGLVPRHALDLALLMAVTRGIVNQDDSVVCLYGSEDAARLDTVRLLHVNKDLRIPLSLRSEFESGEIDFQVLLRVFKLATELAREGREGRPIGTLIVLGDYEHVQEHCHQLVINPFKGYDDEDKNILDPSLAETVKEFAYIDGAFIVRSDGVIMSAGSFIRVSEIGEQLESGLGARHTAGQAITACTKAL